MAVVDFGKHLDCEKFFRDAACNGVKISLCRHQIALIFKSYDDPDFQYEACYLDEIRQLFLQIRRQMVGQDFLDACIRQHRSGCCFAAHGERMMQGLVEYLDSPVTGFYLFKICLCKRELAFILSSKDDEILWADPVFLFEVFKIVSRIKDKLRSYKLAYYRRYEDVEYEAHSIQCDDEELENDCEYLAVE